MSILGLVRSSADFIAGEEFRSRKDIAEQAKVDGAFSPSEVGVEVSLSRRRWAIGFITAQGLRDFSGDLLETVRECNDELLELDFSKLESEGEQ